MNVICLITVVVGIFGSKTEVRGKVLAESGSMYLVDFSADAKKNGYEGDYSENMVEKSKCIKFK